MGYPVQIVVDSAAPHALADWWARTLGWQVEPVADVASAAITDPSGPPGSPRVLFRTVPEPKTVKDRIHLDVLVAPDDVASVRARLESRGAAFLHEGHQGDTAWVTMADPEGNEFCLTE
ncbi:MAG: VOC family protein [Cellulomonadaceae bacterium]